MVPDNLVIQAHDLTKKFADFVAVDQVCFTVQSGECLGMLGPNGAGKTTIMRMLLGQIIPTAGRLRVLDYSIPKQARLMRYHMGVVPQEDTLDVDFTVIENLRSYARFFGLGGPELEQRFEQLLRFVRLFERKHTKVPVLSGGMKRRLALARALVNQPKLLLLDEPTTGLDPQARQLLWQRLRQLKTEETTLILTTHYLEEAERLCDRVLVIEHGKIIVTGTPKTLIQTHVEPYVIEVYGTALDRWQSQHVDLPIARSERIGETLLCYCHDEKPVLQRLTDYPGIEFLMRPANLEDVFLKLTGRELRDG